MRCWLVERDYDDKGLVRLVYASGDGSRRLIRERSSTMLGGGVPAAVDADPDRLDAVDDPGARERYAAEVERMRERHDPEDAV